VAPRRNHRASHGHLEGPLPSGADVDRETGLAYGALVTVQLLFATLPVAGKLGLQDLHPTVFVAIRAALGALVLVGLERVVHASPIPGAGDLARLAVYAVFGVVLNQALFMWGLDLTTAVNASLLLTLIPVMTYGVAILAGHEPLDLRRGAGILVALAGVLVLLDPRRFALGAERWLGDVLVLANGLSYAIYLVVSRPILTRLPPLTTIAWIFVFGGAMLVPLALWQAGPGAFLVDGRSAGILAYVILGPTAAVYALNLWALKRVSSSTVAAFIYLQPVAGVLLAWWILDDPVPVRTVLAGALVFAGVALVSLGTDEDPPADAPVDEPGAAADPA